METYPGWLELLLAWTNFYGPKPVRTIEVLLLHKIAVQTLNNRDVQWGSVSLLEIIQMVDCDGIVKKICKPTDMRLPKTCIWTLMNFLLYQHHTSRNSVLSAVHNDPPLHHFVVGTGSETFCYLKTIKGQSKSLLYRC